MLAPSADVPSPTLRATKRAALSLLATLGADAESGRGVLVQTNVYGKGFLMVATVQ